MEIRTIAVIFVLVCFAAAGKKEPRELNTGKKGRTRHYRDRDEGQCQLEVACKGDVDELSMPVKLPIRGPRGPPGMPGEKGEAGVDGRQGPPGLPGPGWIQEVTSSGHVVSISAPVPRKIAFFVGLSDNMGPVTEHTDIVFDRVVTNIGGGYDVTTGRFTAPANGTYQFNIIVSAQGRQKAAVMIVKNGAMIATVWAESIPYWATASNVAILSMDRGDQVWLILLNRASYLHGYMYTTFSGFIVFEN